MNARNLVQQFPECFQLFFLGAQGVGMEQMQKVISWFWFYLSLVVHMLLKSLFVLVECTISRAKPQFLLVK